MAKRTSVKERVLRMATEKFLRQGYYKVSMDQLVKELRTSKSSLYNHFRSKEELVEAVLLQLNTRINNRLEEIMADDKLSFKGRLVAISAFTKDVLTEVSEEFLSDLEIHTPQLWEQYQTLRTDRINRYYRNLFEMGIREGVLRNDIDPELILSVYLSLTEIPLRYQKVNQLGIPHEKIYEDITNLFLNGVLRRS